MDLPIRQMIVITAMNPIITIPIIPTMRPQVFHYNANNATVQHAGPAQHSIMILISQFIREGIATHGMIVPIVTPILLHTVLFPA